MHDRGDVEFRMQPSTHERLIRSEPLAPGSERSFGVVMAVAFALISLVNWWHGKLWWPWTAGLAVLFLAGTLVPPVLKPLNWAWFRLGLLLQAVISPIVLGLVFFLAVTPLGWILRARGNDLLKLKREPGSGTYWLARRPPGPLPETLKDQF